MFEPRRAVRISYQDGDQLGTVYGSACDEDDDESNIAKTIKFFRTFHPDAVVKCMCIVTTSNSSPDNDTILKEIKT